MSVTRIVSGVAVSCLLVLGAAQSAFAGLKIELIQIENPQQPGAPLVTGGGQLREIMKIAAENWERVFKHANGNWKITIEYGWGNIAGDLYGQEYFISERGNNPSRPARSCILFNLNPIIDAPLEGLFADPTPWENSEYLDYRADTINTDYGWLNVGRAFNEATGAAENRVDLLMLAMHEIGHALGLDPTYSGLINQYPGFGALTIKSPRPFAGVDVFLDTGPHIANFDIVPLMYGKIDGGTRKLISAADALLLAQINLVDRPDLSEPSLDFNGDGRKIPTRSVSSSSTCPPPGPPTTEN